MPSCTTPRANARPQGTRTRSATPSCPSARSTESAESLVKLVAQSSRLVYPTERLRIIKDDESGNRILECAVAAGANFLITGDKKHLLPIKKHKEIAIVSPKDFFLLAGMV